MLSLNRVIAPDFANVPVNRTPPSSESSHAGVAFNDRLTATTPASLPPVTLCHFASLPSHPNVALGGETPARSPALAAWISCLIVPPLGGKFIHISSPKRFGEDWGSKDLSVCCTAAANSPLENYHLQGFHSVSITEHLSWLGDFCCPDYSFFVCLFVFVGWGVRFRLVLFFKKP